MLKRTLTPLLVIGLLIAGLFSTTGCKKKETATTDINGVWSRNVSSVPFKLSLNNDNSYSYASSGITLESGSCSHTGSSFGFEAQAGPGFLITADYNYTLSGKTLILVASWDTCPARSAVLSRIPGLLFIDK